MLNKIKDFCAKSKLFQVGMELFKKYEEIIVYLIVGVMTTIVSWFCMFFVNIVILNGMAV